MDCNQHVILVKDIKTSSTAKCLVLQYVFTSKYSQIPETGQKFGSEKLNHLLYKGPQVSDFACESPNLQAAMLLMLTLPEALTVHRDCFKCTIPSSISLPALMLTMTNVLDCVSPQIKNRNYSLLWTWAISRFW